MNLPFAAIIVLGLARLTAGPFAQEKTEQETTGAPTATRAEADTIRAVQIDSFAYASLEMSGSYDQHDSAFSTLYAEAGRQGLPMLQPPFGIYWNSPDTTSTDQLRWEVGLVVPQNAKVKAPLKLKQWRHTQAVSRRYTGPFESAEAQRARTEMYEWIQKRGYRVSGPFLERFLTIPQTNAEGQTVGTVEFLIPVVKREQ